MSLDARIRELSERHKRLEDAIAAELKHPAGDDLRVHELKVGSPGTELEFAL